MLFPMGERPRRAFHFHNAPLDPLFQVAWAPATSGPIANIHPIRQRDFSVIEGMCGRARAACAAARDMTRRYRARRRRVARAPAATEARLIDPIVGSDPAVPGSLCLIVETGC